jgi:hypothetical protein
MLDMFFKMDSALEILTPSDQLKILSVKSSIKTKYVLSAQIEPTLAKMEFVSQFQITVIPGMS